MCQLLTASKPTTADDPAIYAKKTRKFFRFKLL